MFTWLVIIIGITDSALSFIAFAFGFAVDLVLLIYAGAKYNRYDK